MRGGSSRSWSSSVSPRSSSIRPGRRFIRYIMETCAYWFNGNGANYLSPFFSPEIFGYSPHAIFGTQPAWWPAWMFFSPAFLVLWAPAGFRFTCYYYRGAYYKAFWADPINCAVGEPRKKFLGEHSFPAHHPKYSPLFVLSGGAVHRDPFLRRLDGNVVHRRDGQGTFWHRRRNDCADVERSFSRPLHFRLPLAATFDRRISGFKIQSADLCESLQLRELPQHIVI